MNHTSRISCRLFLAATILLPAVGMQALDDSARVEQDPASSADAVAINHPPPVETEHVIELDGESIRYRAVAGTLPLFEESDGSVKAEIFHVAYMALEERGGRAQHESCLR